MGHPVLFIAQSPLYLLDTYYSQYEALNPKPTNSSEVGLESRGGEAGAV